MITRIKRLVACGLALAAVAFNQMCSAATYYKVGSDGDSSFNGNPSSSLGWSTTSGSSTTTTITDFANSDFVVNGGLMLRTTASDSTPLVFNGRSLTLTDNAVLMLKKNKNGNRTVSISDLRVCGNASINAGNDNSTFTLTGALSLQPSAVLKFIFSTNANDERGVVVSSILTGDETTRLVISSSGSSTKQPSSRLTLNSVEGFKGTIDDDGSTRTFQLIVNGAFGGTLTGLPSGTTAAWFDFGGLPTETGLRIATATPSSAVKTKLRFFSSTKNFNRGGQKLLTFPAGSEVKLEDFTLVWATTAGGATSSFYGLEQVTNSDDTVSFVTKSGPTYYKVKDDPAGDSSFAGNAKDTTVGWALSADATAPSPLSAVVMAASDFVVSNKQLRTPSTSGSSWTFNGQSLRLIGDGASVQLNVKSDNNATITFPDLKLEDAVINNGEPNRTYTLNGVFNIADGKSVSFCSADAYTRGFNVSAAVYGDTTTKIRTVSTAAVNTSSKSTTVFGNLGGFYGTFEDVVEKATSTITFAGAFNGCVGSISPNTTLRVNYEGLSEGKGLRATVVSDALKTKLKFFGKETAFDVDNLPLIRFPAGTEVEPDSFEITYAASADGAGTQFPALKTLVDADDDDAVVLAVDAAAPIYAKLKKDDTGTYAWRFYGVDWRDITERCGLTEPTDEITVCFDSSAEFEAVKASGCTAAGYRMTAFTVTDDVDLTSGGFAFTTDAGLSIDLEGHAMTVPTSFFTGAKTVTDSVGGGELHVHVASGRLTNTDVALTGALKLVKDGSGEFLANRSNQSYTGGTAILGGKAVANDVGTTHRYGAAGSEIFVDKDASFEFGGKISFYEYQFVLNGGTLTNSTKPSEQHWNYPLLGSVRLEADSSINFANYGFIGKDFGPTSLDLNGYTLDLTYSGNAYFMNTTATEGRINAHGSIEFYKGDFVGTNTTLDIDDWMTLRETDVHVGTYIARATSNVGNQNGDIFVYKRFQPITDKFWGCVMKSGSTLDLSTRTGAWDVKNNLVSSNGSYKKKSVTFENGATIYVDLGDRAVHSKDKIISWTDATKPPANVKFRPMPGTNYSFVAEGDGLYAVKGMIIILR